MGSTDAEGLTRPTESI